MFLFLCLPTFCVFLFSLSFSASVCAFSFFLDLQTQQFLRYRGLQTVNTPRDGQSYWFCLDTQQGTLMEVRICAICGGEGRFRCAGCHSVRYCSTRCQRAGWRSHKFDCKRAKAAKTKAAKGTKSPMSNSVQRSKKCSPQKKDTGGSPSAPFKFNVSFTVDDKMGNTNEFMCVSVSCAHTWARRHNTCINGSLLPPHFAFQVQEFYF